MITALRPSIIWYRFRKWLHYEFGWHKLSITHTPDKFAVPRLWCKICGMHWDYN